MKTTYAAIMAVVIAGVSFFGGMKFRDYQISKTRASFANGSFRGGQTAGGVGINTNGQNRPNGNRFGGGGAVEGQVVSMDDNSITVKMQDGSTKIVILSDSTTYNKSTDGTKSDLQQGSTVAIFGTPNSDGSITAQSVQLNPQLRQFGGQGSTTPSPSK